MENSNKKTLVFGASLKEERYSNKAIRMLQNYDIEVVGIGLREGKINEISLLTGHPDLKNIDTISLYLSPQRQDPHIDYLLSLNPKRIIFNPGTENSEFYQKAINKDIEAINACTLVMLRTEQF